VFAFNKGDSYDTLWDFSATEGDKIRLDPAFMASLADLQATCRASPSRAPSTA
jgi:hypothetical protein